MYIIFDTETTGLLNADAAPLQSQPRVIEYAGVKLDNDLNQIDELEFICDPGVELSDKITELTGLRTSDVAGKPSFSKFFPALVNFHLGVNSLVSHNLTFDINILRYEFVRLDKVTAFPWPPNQICTIEKTFHIEGYRLNLQKLHKHVTGEDHINGAHRAMNDVKALVKCFRKLKEEKML